MQTEDRTLDTSGRFVLLWHELPATIPRASHWDLMLQKDDLLLTYELPSVPDRVVGPAQTEHPQSTSFPAVEGTVELPAKRLPDHRIEYLEYEGSISGDRGHVRRVAHGTYTLPVQDDVRAVGMRPTVQVLLDSPALRAELSIPIATVGETILMHVHRWSLDATGIIPPELL